MATCEKCPTPLDAEGRCVTCEAKAEGLELLSRSTYDSVREMHAHLQASGIEAHMERVPPGRPEDVQRPLWNLYAPAEAVEGAVAALRKHWADLLDAPEAAEAAARGQSGIDLEAGGEVTCPACGHRFALPPGGGDCPDCGLSLGVA